MRHHSQVEQIEKFIVELGLLVNKPVKVYFTGGATAVMLGIRESTIDVDIKFEPDEIQVYRAIQVLKEKLNMNIELASPDNFIPPLPHWRERSIFITKNKNVSFFHYDLYSQIIAKIQRGWKQDLTDVIGFLKLDIDRKKLLILFDKIKIDFIKYPSSNAEKLERKLKKFLHE